MNDHDRTSRQLTAGLVDLAGTSAPDYRNDILRQVARTRQRPAWTFPERWIPMLAITRPARTMQQPRSAWLLLSAALLAAALVAGLIIAGSSLLRPAPDDGLRGLAVIPALELDSTWDATAIPGLSLPSGMDVGPDGDLYVINGGTSEILVLDRNGSVIRRWGESGSGQGQFVFRRDPGDPAGTIGGVAVGPDGSVYVADTANRRIQKFGAAGKFVRQWGGYGPTDGLFLDPIDVSIGPDGSVYVVDDRRDDIQRFDADGRYVATIGSHGTGDGQLSGPGGIVADAGGNLYNADWANDRVQTWAPDGSFAWSLGSKGTGPGAFDLPNDVDVDTSGEIHVTDSHRVQVFGPDRTYLSAWVGPGTTDLDVLTFLSVAPDGSVYVSGSLRNVIYKLRAVEQAPLASVGPVQGSAPRTATTAVAATVPSVGPSAPVGGPTTPFIVDQTFPVSVTFDLPSAWTMNSLARGRVQVWDPTKGSAFVGADVVLNAYPGGCAAEPLSPALGPSVDDLTDALTHLAGYRAGPVTDVTIDGYTGKAFDLDFDGCASGDSNQWSFDAGTSGGVQETPAFSANTHQHIAVVDVDGTRVLLQAWIFADAKRNEVTEAYQVFDSIRLGSLPASACATPNSLCLGDLAAGEHGSEAFEPRGSARAARSGHRAGAVTYAVPAGWSNAADQPADYALVPQATYRGSATLAPSQDVIHLFARPIATTRDDCDFVPDPEVGRSVDALVAWVSTSPGVVASAPESIDIDGHQATVVDIHVDPATAGSCSWFDWGPLPWTARMTEADMGLAGYGTSVGPVPKRLVFVDLGHDDVVMFQIEAASSDTFEAFVAQAMPIVESFTFAD